MLERIARRVANYLPEDMNIITEVGVIAIIKGGVLLTNCTPTFH